MKRRIPILLVMTLAGLGLWQMGEGVWIHAKAALAQYLLEQAWAETRTTGQPVRPWPWADTWPVARMRLPAYDVDLIVLEGDSGRTLAFGPGWAPASAQPGESGTVLISAHRDTHFSFVRNVRQGDRIVLEAHSMQAVYEVTSMEVADARQARIVSHDSYQRLAIVTCYPFDAITPRGPLRYVVNADLVETRDN